MPLQSGTRLGPYTVLNAIGTGGMGEVYRAQDTRLGRDVAIKVLPEEFTSDRERLKRFEREARAAAALSHTNVLVVYDVGTDGGVFYVVTELLEGETLRARLKHEAMPVEKAVDIVIQIASGLSAAHARGIVHRDLKPENVFITHNGVVKILDFGVAGAIEPLASASEAATFATDTGILLGTIGYMAPEQVRGGPTDARSDIFSIGVILYEALAGYRPFKGDSDAETLCAILEKDPPPFHSFGVTVPAPLARIVTRCLEKQPASRFQSAADLIDVIKSSVSRANKPASKVAEKSIAVLPFANMDSASDQEYFSDGLAEELINALAQLSGLRVASRSSAFRFRGHDLDIRDIGKQLNVDTVLEGSVRRAGKRLRVTVQLIDVANGYHLWSERYDRELADVFVIQDEITQAILQKLEPKLLGQTQAANCRHSDNAEAFALYLKGRHFWYQRTEPSLRAGVQCFMKAIELDPDYALAHAGLADSYSIMRPWGYVAASEARDRTEAAAKRALELSPTLAEAHFSMALYHYWLTDDWPDAEPYFEKAVELQPQSSMLWSYYGHFLSNRHRFQEATSCVERAIEIDTMSPFARSMAALTMYIARHYERTIAFAQQALDLHPDFAHAIYALGLATCRLGRYDESIEHYSRLVSATNRAPVVIGMLGSAYAFAGRVGDAELLLNELRDRGSRQYVDPLGMALIYLGLGDLDNLEQQLKTLLEQHGAYANVENILGPYLDSLADQPRFQVLFREFRLPARHPHLGYSSNRP